MQAPGFSPTAISSTPHRRLAHSPSDSELKTISHRHPDSKSVRALPLRFLFGHSANSAVNSAIRAGSFTHTDLHRSARRFKPKSVVGNLQPGKGTAYDLCLRFAMKELVNEITKSPSTAILRITTITVWPSQRFSILQGQGHSLLSFLSITYAIPPPNHRWKNKPLCRPFTTLTPTSFLISAFPLSSYSTVSTHPQSESRPASLRRSISPES
jgi:hypothetical protein